MQNFPGVSHRFIIRPRGKGREESSLNFLAAAVELIYLVERAISQTFAIHLSFGVHMV